MNIREVHARAVRNIERLEKDIEAMTSITNANSGKGRVSCYLSELEVQLREEWEVWRQIKEDAMHHIKEDKIP